MAHPDCDDGWLPYAHELDAALAVADFTKGARIVLREVFAQIFGLAKSRTARLAPARIAERAGAKREMIARAIKELRDALVLVPEEDGTFRFNKDYETWVQSDGRRPSTGTLRLTPLEVAYCLHAPVVVKAYKYDFDESKRNQPVTENSTNRNQPVTPTVTNRLQNRNQPVTKPANRNERAELENGEGRGEEFPPPPFREGTLPLSDPVEEQPARRPTNFAPDLGTASALVSGPGKDSQEAIDLEAWAVQFGTDTNRESYAIWARSACNYVPATWVRALLRNKVEGRTDRKGLAYLNSVLGAWMNEGRCKYLTDSGPLSQARPASPTEYHQAPANSRHRIKRDH